MTLVRAYYELCKPRVVLLMLLTVVVGMLLASPIQRELSRVLIALLGIGCAAAAGGVLNQLIDRHIDARMYRTQLRPLPSGKISVNQALVFASILTGLGMTLLFYFVNTLTALLTFLTLIGYGLIYTVFLKRATPQNIVIGGLAGAMPPLLGWTAVTGTIHYQSLLLVLIIFTWTPPHFWALAIARHEEYAKADIPMLPVTHGIRFTQLHIMLYTLLMIAATLLPFATRMSGSVYLIGVSILNSIFLYYAWQVYRRVDAKKAFALFRYSIYYLLLVFILLLGDHYF